MDWIHTVTKQINLRQKLFPSSPTTSPPHSRDKCVKQQVSSLAQQWLIKRVGLFIRRRLFYTFPRNFAKTPGRDRASVKNFSRWFGNFCFVDAKYNTITVKRRSNRITTTKKKQINITQRLAKYIIKLSERHLIDVAHHFVRTNRTVCRWYFVAIMSFID